LGEESEEILSADETPPDGTGLEGFFAELEIVPLDLPEEQVEIRPPKASQALKTKESRRELVASWFTGVVENIKPQDRKQYLERRRVLSQRIPRKMDDRFLRTVSRKLQNDRLRIKEFQLQTDRFRNSLITGQTYYNSVLSLFGSMDSADEILMPLMDTLPEPAKRKELMDVYAAKRRRGYDPDDYNSLAVTASNVVSTVGGWIGTGSGAVVGWAKSIASTVASRAAASQSTEIMPANLEEQDLLDFDEDAFVFQEPAPEIEGEEEESDEVFVLEDDVVDTTASVFDEKLEEQQEIVDCEARARQLLGERNWSYFQVRVDLYSRGAINAVDFYRSILNLSSRSDRDKVIEVMIKGKLLSEWHKKQLKTIHENTEKSLGALEYGPLTPK